MSGFRRTGVRDKDWGLQVTVDKWYRVWGIDKSGTDYILATVIYSRRTKDVDRHGLECYVVVTLPTPSSRPPTHVDKVSVG